MPLKNRQELFDIANQVYWARCAIDDEKAIQLLDQLQVDTVITCRALAGNFRMNGFGNAYEAINAALENREKI